MEKTLKEVMENFISKKIEELENEKEEKNYKIYHSLDDFFVNKNQLEKLKLYSPQNVVCLNNGSHLGFLYRKEFQEAFKKDIVMTN